jgi:hypothetical protein
MRSGRDANIHTDFVGYIPEKPTQEIAPPPRSEVFASEIARAPDQDKILADVRRLYPGTPDEQVAFYTQRNLAENKRLRISENILRSMRRNDPLLVPSTTFKVDNAKSSPGVQAKDARKQEPQPHPSNQSSKSKLAEAPQPTAPPKTVVDDDPIEAFIRERISTQKEVNQFAPAETLIAQEATRTISHHDLPLPRPSLSIMQPTAPTKSTRLVYATNPLLSERISSGAILRISSHPLIFCSEDQRACGIDTALCSCQSMAAPAGVQSRYQVWGSENHCLWVAV